MRKLRPYVPKDEFEMPKTIDKKRYTAVLIRQSDHRAEADHVFSRESQLKLVKYAVRLRDDEDDKWVRLYDEGAGVSGQKRIDQREVLNRLYSDIQAGLVGSLVIMHEDRLFRDEYHTNDTTFIKLLAKHNVLLFVRTDHRRYDCTKPSDRNSLLDKMIASRNYLDDHVLGRMNGSQEAKALEGLFDGRNLPMGYVIQGVERIRTRDSNTQSVLKHILRDTKGILYVTHPNQPEYVRQEPVRDHKSAGKLYRDITFTIRAHLIDDIFLERVKALAIADQHIAETIEQSITSLEEKHAEAIVSIDDQLTNVRLEIKKTLAFLHDKILTLTPKEKGDYNKTLAGLRDREQALLEAQEQATQADLKKDFKELEDLLADIPGKLESTTMERKHKLAKPISDKFQCRSSSCRSSQYLPVMV